MANANALAIAKAVQAHALSDGSYDSSLSDFASDLGGTLPMNPCTGNNSGYNIVATSSTTATVTASSGTNCGNWTPTIFSLLL